MNKNGTFASSMLVVAGHCIEVGRVSSRMEYFYLKGCSTFWAVIVRLKAGIEQPSLRRSNLN
ncbi:BBT_HP_G0131700.mRNA.1.CDS.1 [Saccharomyces cerevisiae]|nr:BBT_HP_G0131700.mRNA.1.CDS.1 [Saccharomyces cerevisiae]CAI6975375.1 BBT_HP_G0131700.mRNA.1.CDS.1 [Saccharomyces cerevisiae]